MVEAKPARAKIGRGDEIFDAIIKGFNEVPHVHLEGKTHELGGMFHPEIDGLLVDGGWQDDLDPDRLEERLEGDPRGAHVRETNLHRIYLGCGTRSFVVKSSP